MTWTYGGDPGANDRDEVRFLCGDTDTTDQLVTDEEIAYAIDDAGNNKAAAALICDSIAAEFARDVDVKNGPGKEWASQRYDQYTKKAKELRAKASTFAKPKFGGQSISDKKTLADDYDVPQPFFERGVSDIDGGPHFLNSGEKERGD